MNLLAGLGQYGALRLPCKQAAAEQFLEIGNLKRELRLAQPQAAGGAIDAALIGDLEEAFDGGDFQRQARGPLVIVPGCRRLLHQGGKLTHARENGLQAFLNLRTRQKGRKLAGRALDKLHGELSLEPAQCA